MGDEAAWDRALLAGATVGGVGGAGTFGRGESLGAAEPDLAAREEVTAEADLAQLACQASFNARTRVLLADGRTALISSLKPGQKVLATDTATGRNHAETITAVIVHFDTNLYDLRIKSRSRAETIATTSNHLIWDPVAKVWVKSADLRSEQALLTPNGIPAVADGGYVPTSHKGWMWDLTVVPTHDFYVLSGNTPVLVHNADCGQVGLASTNLAKMAYDYRVGNRIGPSQNVAVYEYETGAGPGYITTDNVPNGPHSEVLINNYIKAQGIDPGSVTAIYSERAPCIACGPTLQMYPNADISWSLSGTSGQNYAALQNLLAYGP